MAALRRMHFYGPVRFLRFAVVVAMAGCADGGGGPSDGGPAERDGGFVDAGRADGGRDAGRDGGVDAGPPPDPVWEQMPGTVEGCEIERAAVPAGAGRIEWEPCPGLEGCKQIAGTRVLARIGALVSGVGTLDAAGRPRFVLVYDLPARRPTVLLVRGDSEVVAAWRNPSFDDPGICGVGEFGMSRTHATWTSVSDSGLEKRELVYRASHEEAWQTVDALASFDAVELAGPSYISRLATSDVMTGVDVRPSALYAVGDEGYVRLPAGGLEMPENFSDVTVVGRTLFWIKYTPAPTTIMVGGIDREAEVYHAPEGGEVSGLATDDLGNLAWVEGYGSRGDGTFDRTELWVGEVTDDPADLAPRKVAEHLPGRPREGRFMGGQYAYIWDGVQVIDMETGVRRVMRPPGTPETLLFTQPAYVTADEVLVEFVWDGERRPRRLALDVLGVVAE